MQKIEYSVTDKAMLIFDGPEGRNVEYYADENTALWVGRKLGADVRLVKPDYRGGITVPDEWHVVLPAGTEITNPLGGEIVTLDKEKTVNAGMLAMFFVRNPDNAAYTMLSIALFNDLKEGN